LGFVILVFCAVLGAVLVPALTADEELLDFVTVLDFTGGCAVVFVVAVFDEDVFCVVWAEPVIARAAINARLKNTFFMTLNFITQSDSLFKSIFCR